MARYSQRQYQLQVAVLMAVYALLIVFEWPLVPQAHDLVLRALLALLPAIPVVLVIVTAARQVVRGDELQQRVHLIALSIAAAVVSAASIVGALLVLAHVWRVGGDVLIWVFPGLCLVYGVTRTALVRKLTGTWTCG